MILVDFHIEAPKFHTLPSSHARIAQTSFSNVAPWHRIRIRGGHVHQALSPRRPWNCAKRQNSLRSPRGPAKLTNPEILHYGAKVAASEAGRSCDTSRSTWQKKCPIYSAFAYSDSVAHRRRDGVMFNPRADGQYPHSYDGARVCAILGRIAVSLQSASTDADASRAKRRKSIARCRILHVCRYLGTGTANIRVESG